MVHSKEKKNKPTKTVPEKYLTMNLLDKDVKTTTLKTSEELKDNMEKVKKMMYEQTEISIKRQKT